MKIHSYTIDCVEFKNGESISVGDYVEGFYGMIVKITKVNNEIVKLLFVDGDEETIVYFDGEDWKDNLDEL